MLGLNTSWKHVSTEVRDYVRRQEAQLERTLGLLHALLSCTSCWSSTRESSTPARSPAYRPAAP